MHYLLLSCSSKKKLVDMPIKAVDLYDGVFFAVLKKALRIHRNLDSNIKLFIISAKYGLIESTDYISYYDQKMTTEIAAHQRRENTTRLKSFIENDNPQSLVAVMGRTYLESIDFSDFQIPIMTINGEIGVMLHGLKEWLDSVAIEG